MPPPADLHRDHPTAEPHDHEHDHDHDQGSGLWARVRHVITPHSHDAADSLDAALESSARGIRAVKISLVGLMVTALFQLAVVAASGSVALLADTIHNFSDALTAVPLWIAFVIGRRAPTRGFTHGYGRGEDLAGLFVLAMIALSAILAGWQAIDRLMHPAPVTNLGWVALAGSAALVADGHHARTDGLTSLAVLIGAGGVAIGWAWADPAVGLLITIAILLVLRTAAREVFRRLMDGVEPDLLNAAETALTRVPGVLAVSDLRMRWVGHEVHAEAAVDIDPGQTLTGAHAIIHRAEQELLETVPRLTRAIVRPRPQHTPTT